MNGPVVTRRNVLRTAGLLLLTGLAAAFRAMTSRDEALRRRPRTLVIPPEKIQPVTFVEGVVLVQSDSGDLRAFSARCTHLGCAISRETNGELVCPCHGSRFRLDGTVAAGPAAAPLERLACRRDPASGRVTVDVV